MSPLRSTILALVALSCAGCDVTGRAKPSTPTNAGPLVGIGEGSPTAP